LKFEEKPMYSGTVVRFDPVRAFGFIDVLGPDGSALGNVFFHISAVRDRRALSAGMLVTFDLKMDNQNRPNAVDVREAVREVVEDVEPFLAETPQAEDLPTS
jgi:cold shock CspA family protein